MSIDLSASISKSLDKVLARARKLHNEGKNTEAALAYQQCAKLMERYAKYALVPETRAERLKKAKDFKAIAKNLLSTPSREKGAPVETEMLDEYKSVISGLVHKSRVNWSDIAGLADAKKEIKTAYGMSLAQKPPGVRLEGWRKILFYGPPGNGKTLLAAATSNGLDATFYNVKVSDLVSKYFGESTKLVSSLFCEAKQTAPSVIFLDEFDSICLKRGRDESGAEKRILSTILAELDGLADKKSEEFVLTIAATNMPWIIDDAVLSRFEKKIYIPHPDLTARKKIFQLQIEGKGLKSEVSFDKLAEQGQGLSGREIERLCKEAINNMIAESNPDFTEEVDKGLENVKKYRLKIKPLSQKDLDLAFSKIKPETSSEALLRFKLWKEGLEH